MHMYGTYIGLGQRGQLWKFTDGIWGLLHGLKRLRCSQILLKKIVFTYAQLDLKFMH